MTPELFARIFTAAIRRRSDISPPFEGYFRLFDGFAEGVPGLTVELFAKTVVINCHSAGLSIPGQIPALITELLPFVKCIVLKHRQRSTAIKLLYGTKPDSRITEHGVRYAIDLTLNQDNSFYGDTANLRKWLIENSRNKRVLNTFAYTGSLGTAAAAGGAASVLQTDLNAAFLAVAKRSMSLNKLYYTNKNFLAGNFFPVVSRLKKAGALFDIVILDPPFFSTTSSGTVDLAAAPERLINKLRPLVADGGTMAVVNNSLYLSGREFSAKLDALCDNCYLQLQKIIPVPDEFTGTAARGAADPAPFNHPTKIVLLQVHRKN